MGKKYQVTLFTTNGKYRPISTIVEQKEDMDKIAIKNKGVVQICHKKGWTQYDLRTYTYLKVKIREVEENGN